MNTFAHPALEIKEDKPFIYTAMSKHLFYLRMSISKYVLENGGVPLNPFMIFDYFLLDTVDRDVIRGGNNNLVKRCDEVWVFGRISDGVLAEIKIATDLEKPIRYFTLDASGAIKESTKESVEMEEGLEGMDL